LLIRHRLMPTSKINDRKSAKSETERSGDEVTLIIRAPVEHRPGHGLEIRASDRR